MLVSGLTTVWSFALLMSEYSGDEAADSASAIATFAMGMRVLAWLAAHGLLAAGLSVAGAAAADDGAGGDIALVS